MSNISFENWSNQTETIPTRETAKYIDMVELDDRDYIITQIVDPASPQEGNIDVREILQDWCPNGISIPYVNVEKSDTCKEFETAFNNPNLKRLIVRGTWQPLDVMSAMGFDVHKSSLSSTQFEENQTFSCVGVISKEEFEDMKRTLDRIGETSAYQLQKRIDTLRKKKTS